ncbi:hypothetical protein QQS21_011699 [Conoideocrella luteorostrata]|uniref:Uncharacterized protein n=1 Tax=Conoideocrella luteorostrata TaxID=1105319 RepID=A0AAJ0CH60_9HYPO|nr:hypothetical protein QQS21_011699 [Conoideocrella luteorostrata]
MTALRSLLLSGIIWCLYAVGSGSAERGHEPPFNSTGTASFYLDGLGIANPKPWYVSIALKYSLGPHSFLEEKQMASSFISVPDEFINSAEANATRMCAYHIFIDPKMSISRRRKERGEGSCKGLLRDACMKYIQNFRRSLSFAGDECPKFEIGKGCEPGVIYRSTPTDYTSFSGLRRGLDGVADIPEDYHTDTLFGTGFHDEGKKAYKRHQREPYPMLLAFSHEQSRENAGGDGETKYSSNLLCVAPSKAVAQRSYKPKGL